MTVQKKKILTVVGTRPEAIKMAVLIKKLSADERFDHRLCLTGQHREMMDVVISFFDLHADYDLDLMKPNQDLYDITSGVALGMRGVLDDYKPDLVLVHGDTTTAFIAALSAFYKKIPVGHVEAGLRTYDFDNPFPEEANRVLISRLATWHFAPTASNHKNLSNELVNLDSIFVTGNTVIDALKHAAEKVQAFSHKVSDKKIVEAFSSGKKIVLITGHRRENFGEKIKNISEAIKYLAQKYEDIFFIYPVHLNPNIKKPVLSILSGFKNIILTEPLDYHDFVFAMKNSWLILTDSGGIQEEAPALGIPVLVMRENTERPEAVDSGTVKLVGSSRQTIIENFQSLIENSTVYNNMKKAINPYGDGQSSEKIIEFLAKNL